MAKMQAMPTTTRGGIGKVVALFVAVLLLVLLVRDPIGCAHGVRALFDALDRFQQAL